MNDSKKSPMRETKSIKNPIFQSQTSQLNSIEEGICPLCGEGLEIAYQTKRRKLFRSFHYCSHCKALFSVLYDVVKTWTKNPEQDSLQIAA